MTFPLFFIEQINPALGVFQLSEENSKHAVQVLRMQNGEQLQLTDGKGNLFTAQIIDNNKNKCCVQIIKTINDKPSANNITIAISLIKNSSRFEWFLEKATEIGISAIIPLICERTEKQHFRLQRMQSILISAMLQSQQSWLPVLQEPVKYSTVIKQTNQQQKFIAHCQEGNEKVQLSAMQPFGNTTILIGPEGDFTKGEIEQALQNNFVPVSLGHTRLRTETAGVVAAVLLCTL